MPASTFSNLPHQQQAQAAQIFRDSVFGTDPNDYIYGLEHTGELTSQRCRVLDAEKKVQHGKRSPMNVMTTGQLQLPDPACHVLASLLLPVLISDNAEAHPLQRSDVLIAAPSLRLTGWELAGEGIWE